MRYALLVGVMALALLTGCEQHLDWQGWVYPDRNNLADDIPIGSFSTVGQCAASAKAVIVRLEERRDEDGEPIRADYECGYKCKPGDVVGGNVCEKTEH
jgi:hypothetical protein